jgi:hypothetical protein
LYIYVQSSLFSTLFTLFNLNTPMTTSMPTQKTMTPTKKNSFHMLAFMTSTLKLELQVSLVSGRLHYNFSTRKNNFFSAAHSQPISIYERVDVVSRQTSRRAKHMRLIGFCLYTILACAPLKLCPCLKLFCIIISAYISMLPFL